jgi:8-oxo-dGTP pyrophosphatase MutT (NUDIX family)
MRAKDLLAEYARRHGDAVVTRAWRPVAELFADDGELEFVGVPLGPLRGRDAIERAFRERGPDDVFVLGELVRSGRRSAAARYAWRAAPHEVAGTLRLAERDGLIGRLVVRVGNCDLPEPSERTAVRGVVRTPQGDALLVRVVSFDGSSWWLLPGGGRDAGESEDAALRRELREEIGLEDPAIGTCVWTREHVFEWKDVVYRQRERFFDVVVPARFEPRPQLGEAALLAEQLHELRWFSPADMRRAGDVFAPYRLPALMESLTRDGPPAVPVDAGE